MIYFFFYFPLRIAGYKADGPIRVIHSVLIDLED
jgi:hypothetical protein